MCNEFIVFIQLDSTGAKLIVKHFNTSVPQHFFLIKKTSTCNVLPNEVVSSRTVNSFKNSLDKHWAENPPYVYANWQQSSTSCTFQVCTNSRRPAFCWKCTQQSVLLLLLLLLLYLLRQVVILVSKVVIPDIIVSIAIYSIVS